MLPVIRAKREHAVKSRRSHRACFALFCSLLPFWLFSQCQQHCEKENLNRYWRFQRVQLSIKSTWPVTHRANDNNVDDCLDFKRTFQRAHIEGIHSSWWRYTCPHTVRHVQPQLAWCRLTANLHLPPPPPHSHSRSYLAMWWPAQGHDGRDSQPTLQLSDDLL